MLYPRAVMGARVIQWLAYYSNTQQIPVITHPQELSKEQNMKHTKLQNYHTSFLEGKKYLINHWRRDPTKPVSLPFKSPSPIKRGYGEQAKFKLDINDGT
jgi:hypothetical protein